VPTDYLFTNPKPPTTPADMSPKDHGKCVAAYAIGKTHGIARSAEHLVVTVLNYNDGITDSWLDGLRMIYDDIWKNSRQKKSIVNISLGGRLGDPKADVEGWSQPMIDKFRKSHSPRWQVYS
jgi:hypothetical protein